MMRGRGMGKREREREGKGGREGIEKAEGIDA